MDRRDFLKRGAGLAALAGLGTPALEACTAPTAPTAAQPSATPVKGGTFIEAPTFERTHATPLMASAPPIASAMFDGMLVFQADGTLAPLLAQSLPKVSADSLTYTFDLRKDVKWTDGSPLTADDVVFTYRLLYHPDYKAFSTPYRGDLESLIADVQAPDPYTVVIKTKTVNASFMSFHLAYGIMPKKVLGGVPAAGLRNHPFMRAPTVTSGPFKFKEWVPGDHLTTVRNDACYRGAPYVDSYVEKYYAVQTSIFNALKTGEIDAFFGAPLSLYDEFKAAPNLNTKVMNTGNAPRFFYNLDPAAPASKIFSSKAVRQALLYAANREGAAKATLFGYGAIANSTGVFWPGNWALNPDAKPAYAYDRRKAEEMLDADGWRKGSSGYREKNGLPLKFEILTSATNDTWQQITAVFAQNWKDVGANVSIRAVQFAQQIPITLAHEFDMVVYTIPASSFPADPDPSGAYHSRNAVKNVGQNVASYKNPQVDQLLDQAVATLDQAKRKELYFKLQDIINDDVPLWSSWFWQYVWVTNKRVRLAGPERMSQFTTTNRAFMNEVFLSDGK